MKKVRNVLVFALIVVFTFAQLPMSAMAKDVGISQLDDEDFVAQVKEITAFAELAEEVRWQNTNTPQFPDTLESTVEGEVVQIPVTWETDKAYDANEPEEGSYVFTAVVSEDYKVAEGVVVPCITVVISKSDVMSDGTQESSQASLEDKKEENIENIEEDIEDKKEDNIEKDIEKDIEDSNLEINNISLQSSDAYFIGEGVETNPYLIQSAEDLANLAELVNQDDEHYRSAYYELTNDIDLSAYSSGEGWTYNRRKLFHAWI